MNQTGGLSQQLRVSFHLRPLSGMNKHRRLDEVNFKFRCLPAGLRPARRPRVLAYPHVAVVNE